MRYESIADIFSAKEKLRAKLRSVLSDLTEAEATARPDGEKWSVQEIVEHVSIVDTGIARICAKLLAGAKAAGKPANGLAVSEQFLKGAVSIANEKLEAPDRVHPTGAVAIADSLAKMDSIAKEIDGLRDDLNQYDLSTATFPHPYLGEMTAAEWLVMYGGHAARHAAQIERLLVRIRD